MLTQRKRLYAQGRMMGKSQTDASIFAGCPAKTAAQAGSRYEKDPLVIAHMERLRKGEPELVVEKPKPEPRPKPEIVKKEVALLAPTIASGDDPIEFMKTMWQNPDEDPKLRLEAAKAHASYTQAKPGEKGKKEQVQEAAVRAGAGRFGLRAVK